MFFVVRLIIPIFFYRFHNGHIFPICKLLVVLDTRIRGRGLQQLFLNKVGDDYLQASALITLRLGFETIFSPGLLVLSLLMLSLKTFIWLSEYHRCCAFDPALTSIPISNY